jgi:SPP1 family predicted phage head-tail adaptor
MQTIRNNFSSKLRNLIEIQELISEKDKNGEIIHSWKEKAKVYAYVKAIEGKTYIGESFEYAQVVPNTLYKFAVRYMVGITTAMRIIYNNKCFNIRKIINEDELNVALIIIAEEGDIG